MTHLRAFGLGILLCLSLMCEAQQQGISVSEQIFAEHLVKRVAPLYPPIAKAARVTGVVVLDVNVGVSGEVTSVSVVSGPSMLRQAAIDCVKQWRLKPFQNNGTPTPAIGRSTVTFDLGKEGPTQAEAQLAREFFPVSDECHTKSRANADLRETAAACSKAAGIAEQFPPDRRFIEKRSAFVYAASALMRDGDLKEAYRYADLAVEVVKLGHDDDSGRNAAYSVKGFVEAKLGDLAAADRDLTTAEDFERKAIQWAQGEKFEYTDSYLNTLIMDLKIHAQLLQAMGKIPEAQKKMDEASAVK